MPDPPPPGKQGALGWQEPRSWTRAQGGSKVFKVRRAGEQETLIVSPFPREAPRGPGALSDHGVLGVRQGLGSPSSKGRQVGEGMGRSSPPAAPAQVQGGGQGHVTT